MKKFILFVVVLILSLFLSLIFLISSNYHYKEDIIDKINSNYNKKVNYVNVVGNNYVVKTSKDVIVLDKDYKEITSLKLDDIKKLDCDLVYKKNKILYEKIEVKGNKNIYTYLDVLTLEVVDVVEIEG